MTLKVHNTLTQKKEVFISRSHGKVGMYVCGPTTYNFIHLGNARPVVVFDTIRRYLEYRGYTVEYVQNFTDVDDKIIQRAQEQGEEANQLAERFIEAYFSDADALNVRRASVHPRVSMHLPEIIQMIQTLLDKGYAYLIEGGDVYFAVEEFTDYGKLSGRSRTDLQAGARIEIDVRKRNPLDFALWKAAKAGEPSWSSPWGAGRPGWHIECSAMSLKYLGFSFDIHGGGNDLIFPHHENEIAQSEAYAGKDPFCKYWLHNGFITINQEKMSKSLGNFFFVRDILKKFAPQVVRFYLLSTHYRSPLDFDDGKLEMNRRGLERLKTSLDLLDEIIKMEESQDAAARTDLPQLENLGNILAAQIAKAEQAFIEAMDDDFNTARATAALFDLSREVNSATNAVLKMTGRLKGSEKQAFVLARETFGTLLGVLGLEPEFLRQGWPSKATSDEIKHPEGATALLDELAALRDEARRTEKWAQADQIRTLLQAIGVYLEDTPQGQRVRLPLEGVNIATLIPIFVELRQAARQRKDWDMADQLREKLQFYHVVLEDTAHGTRWTFKE